MTDGSKNKKKILIVETEKVQRELKNSVYAYLIKSDIKIDDIVEKVKRIL